MLLATGTAWPFLVSWLVLVGVGWVVGGSVGGGLGGWLVGWFWGLMGFDRLVVLTWKRLLYDCQLASR
jgi:hypothetical protein